MAEALGSLTAGLAGEAGAAGVAGAAGAVGSAGPAVGLLVLTGAGKRRRRLGAWRVVGGTCASSSKPVKNKIRTKAVVFILPLRLRVSNWLPWQWK